MKFPSWKVDRMEPNETYVAGLIAEAAALTTQVATHGDEADRLAALELVGGELHAAVDGCEDPALVADADAVITHVSAVIGVEVADALPMAS